MSKKGNKNAQKPADQQPQAVDQALPEAVVSPATETAVALVGGAGAPPAGQEQPAQPDDAAGEGAGVVSDGQDSGRDLAAGQEPEAVAEGQGDTATDPQPAGGAAGEGAAADDGNVPDAGADAGTADDLGEGSGDQADGGAGSDEAAPADTAGNEAGADEDLSHVEDQALSPADGAVHAAEQACLAVVEYLEELHELDDGEYDRLRLFSGLEHSKATNAMAAIVRSVGSHDNMVALCGTHLSLEGLTDKPELSEAEALVVSTFVSVLQGIERFDTAVEARERAAEEEANRPQPKPVPIDETTLELVDEPGATWGSR